MRNLVSPVEFNAAISVCHAGKESVEGHNRLFVNNGMGLRSHAWLELGPHGALKGPIRETLRSISQEGVLYTSALTRNKTSLSSLLGAAGQLLCNSLIKPTIQLVSLGLTEHEIKSLRPLHNLPKYQFDHSELYWEEPPMSRDFRLRKHGNHDLLGTRINEANSLESEWKFVIKEDEMPWLRDHKADGATLYPAAGMIVMAIEAAKQLMEDDLPIAFVLTDVAFPAPIIISSAPEGIEVRIHMSASVKGTKRETEYNFRLFLLRFD